MIQKIRTTCLIMALLVPAASGLNCSSCSEDLPDVRDLANSMAEEFTEMLEFENGTVEDGPPPQSDPDGPRLDSFTAPLLAGAQESLEDGTVIGHDYDQWFPVLFRSTDDAANLENVAGCYAYVQQANTDDQATRHLRVEPYRFRELVGSEHVFHFRAQVHRLARLRSQLTQALRTRLLPRDVPEGFGATDGNAYHIYIALFSEMPDGSERVGNYLIWNLSTYPGEAGDNPVQMCPAHSMFSANALVDTNLLMLGVPDPVVEEAFGDRPAESSPCNEWNQFAAGYNTIIDSIVELAGDPDYQERSTVLYPAGTRFFRHGIITEAPLPEPPDFQLELAWCPGDLSRCESDADCPTSRHICCDNLCRDTQVSDNFCGSCDLQCDFNESCFDGVCAQVGCQTDDDCPAANEICCGGVCYDSMSDPNHCGVCDNFCSINEECSGGVCTQLTQCNSDTDCPQMTDVCCDYVCYDALIHPIHCGVCNNPCSADEECVDGGCNQVSQCSQPGDCSPPNDLCCGGTCYNSLVERLHCGFCFNPCQGTEICDDGTCTVPPQCTVDADCPLNSDICCGGVCYDSLNDNLHCSFCDNQCIDPLTCQNGQCCPVDGCGNEVVIAKWAFDPDGLGNPSLIATEVAANVIAQEFTSADGVPDRLISPGPIHWVGERDWPNPATALMAFISTEPGWMMTITRIEFDHSMLAMSAGMPTYWELSFMGGPGPLSGGPIQSETPDFIYENVVIPPDIHDPTFVEILWHAMEATDPQLTWGVDNVTIYGTVFQ